MEMGTGYEGGGRINIYTQIRGTSYLPSLSLLFHPPRLPPFLNKLSILSFPSPLLSSSFVSTF